MRRSRTAAALCLALAALAARAAHAQDERDLAQRRLLLDGAEEARDGGEHARALDLAERAGRVHMTASVRRFIAEEQAALGRAGEAFATARVCAHEAAQEAPSPNRERVLAGCDALADSLRGRVGRLVVRVPESRPGLVVRVGERALNAAFWGAEYVLTPGSVLVRAEAPGMPPFAQRVDVPSGAVVVVTVRARRLEPTPRGAPRDAGATALLRVALGPALLGVGGAALLAAGITEGVASANYSALRRDCEQPVPCEPRAAQARREGIDRADAIAAGLAIGGGVVALLGGALTLALRPRTRERPPPVAVALGPAALGVRVTY